MLLFTICLAFAQRTATLDLQSLWSDEGISLLRSNLPLVQMLTEMPVEHLPGYFVGLHYWLRLTGEDRFRVAIFLADTRGACCSDALQPCTPVGQGME